MKKAQGIHLRGRKDFGIYFYQPIAEDERIIGTNFSTSILPIVIQFLELASEANCKNSKQKDCQRLFHHTYARQKTLDHLPPATTNKDTKRRTIRQ